MDTSQQRAPASQTKAQRRLRTNAEKRQIVEEALRGDESVAAVARRHGVNANLLFNWRKLYRQGLLEQCREPASARLVPITVMPSARMDEASSCEAPSSITVELPGEIRLRLEGRVDREALADVLTVLGAR